MYGWGDRVGSREHSYESGIPVPTGFQKGLEVTNLLLNRGSFGVEDAIKLGHSANKWDNFVLECSNFCSKCVPSTRKF